MKLSLLYPYRIMSIIAIILLMSSLIISINIIVLVNQPNKVIRIASGSPELTFNYVVRGIKQAIVDEFDVNNIVTNGAKENLEMLCRGEVQLGLTHAHLEPSCSGLTALANVYQSTLHILAKDSIGIGKVSHIKALHRVALGPEGSGTQMLAKFILSHYELEYQTVNVSSFEEMKKKLLTGDVDIVFLVGGIPIEFIKTLENKAEFRLLSVGGRAGIKSNLAGLVDGKIEKGVYGSSPFLFPEQELSTVAISTILVASNEFGTKWGANYNIERITRLIFEQRSKLLRSHASTMYMDQKFAQTSAYYSIHSGAKSYYESSNSSQSMSPEMINLIAATLTFLASLYAAVHGWIISALAKKGLPIQEEAKNMLQDMPNFQDNVP